MRKSILVFNSILLITCVIYTSYAVVASPSNLGKEIQKTDLKKQKKMKSIHNFKVKDISGNDFDFASLKGKKVMVVNTASECGLTPQYEILEAVFQKYGGEKFTIIGFPANNFGAQEPGSNADIQTFCKKNYGVTFPMMAKVSVKGDDIAPIYKFLTSKSENGVEDVEMVWNFQKILIDENGHFVKSVHPKTAPDDPSIIEWITKN